ncbi:MAG: DUF4350 domain-containing protein [Pseudomonadota bacterium]
MSQARVPLKPILLAVLAALLVWIVYMSIEFYEETVTSGWSREAIRNPYLAAQQFMARSEVEVLDADSLLQLDDLDNVKTLFISEPNQVRNPRQLRHLLAWLETGGHVIYSANSIASGDDLLLQEFEIEVNWREYEDQDEPEEEQTLSETLREYNRQIEEGKTAEEATKALNQTEEILTQVDFGGDIGNLSIEFDDSKILSHPYISGEGYDADKPKPGSWSYSEAGIHLMQFDVGQGLLTIISDPRIWTSYHIEDHDHAYLLWVLSSNYGGFAILRPVLQDSIWVLIGRHAFELLFASGLLVLMWIWHVSIRFGRLIPRDTSRNRALGEHFSSLSHYLWHRKHGDHLIAPLRQRVLRRASLTLGEFSIANEARQIELLAERTGITAQSIQAALSESNLSEAAFVNRVKLLKRIEYLL